jgi:hypothetical protein
MLTWIGILVALTTTLLSAAAPAAAQERERNTCAACHITANRLIAITQQLAKGKPPVAPSLSEGEG